MILFPPSVLQSIHPFSIYLSSRLSLRPSIEPRRLRDCPSIFPVKKGVLAIVLYLLDGYLGFYGWIEPDARASERVSMLRSSTLDH